MSCNLQCVCNQLLKALYSGLQHWKEIVAKYKKLTKYCICVLDLKNAKKNNSVLLTLYTTVEFFNRKVIFAITVNAKLFYQPLNCKGADKKLITRYPP